MDTSTSSSHTSSQRGIAMMTTLLVLTLMSALLIGFTAVIMGDQRFRLIDRDRSRAFYAAMAGLEKMTADLGNLFFVNVAPTPAQVANLTVAPPALADTAFVRADGTSGYTITAGAPSVQTISSGPYQGLMALLTLYSMDVTARTTTGGDVHLQRQTETVAIPVFQFGMFSDVDLSFFAGPNFDFGGRIHTNANLFLSEGAGGTLTLRDKVTAVGEIVRNRLQNGVAIGVSGHTGPVSMAKSTNSFRNLLAGAPGEGSVVDGAGPPMSAINEPTWHSVSLGTYNAYIRNGRTGARPLNLPALTLGGANIAIVQRAPVNENVANPQLFNERFFSQASVRILLSDTVADIMNLPGIDPAGQPVRLDGNWNAAPPPANGVGVQYGPVDATHPPIATSPGVFTATTNANTPNATATRVAVAAMPLFFQIPATIQVGPNLNVICTGRTATTFIGCTGHALASANGAPVTAIVPSGAGTVQVQTTVNGNHAGSAVPITITVASTAGFAPSTFWLGGQIVSCAGYETAIPRFTGCTNVPATNWPATITTNALSNAGIGAIGGFIKVEIQNAALAWQDVTMEILNFGIGDRNLTFVDNGGTLRGVVCADPTPNAILRIQRLKDNNGICDYAGSKNSNDWWPNTLFDTREAIQRDAAPAGNSIMLGGVMHYISLDVRNLSLWLRCTNPYTVAAGCTGNTAKLHDNNGYSVYFSDRRNNRNAANQETGELGWEDFVNPASATGAPNNVADLGENVNGNVDGGGNPILDIYGRNPSFDGVLNNLPPGWALALNMTGQLTPLTRAQAQVNRAVLFRRALKLIKGDLGNIVMPGLTIVSENPVYVQGNWNMNAWPQPAQAVDNHAATSVIADSVTLLSNAWNDNISFTQPYLPGNRVRSPQTFYRLAIISGKGPAFPQPPAPAPGTAANPWDFGTDGGAHNFLHFLEGGGNTVNYVGSIATFYFNRQAVGTYKCCNTVYAPPTRNFAFDIGFLNPALLPPGTPVFRDLNTIGFFVENRPGR